jgi:hypothetical protein
VWELGFKTWQSPTTEHMYCAKSWVRVGGLKDEYDMIVLLRELRVL